MSDSFDSRDSFDDDGWDDELDAELSEAASVFCPYCGEEVEVAVDPAGGEVQEYVEDCEVCCQPWAVRVSVDVNGFPTVSVTTLDEG